MTETANVAKQRMLIFDPCFGGMTGHWENYCKRLYNELSERGYEVVVFGQNVYQPKIIENVNFKPLFVHSPYVEMQGWNSFNQQCQYYLEDFKTIPYEYFRDGDLLLFHSLFPHIFAAIVDWIGDLATYKNITACAFFQFPPAEAKKDVSLLKRFLYKARRLYHGEGVRLSKMDWVENSMVRFYQHNLENLHALVKKKSLLLMASTHVLSRNFSGLFETKVHYIPMPGRKLSELCISNPEPSLLEQGKYPRIKIGYFGHACLEKGGQFLQFLVEKTLAIYPNAEFVLHLNPNKDTERYLKYFDDTVYKNVTCYSGHLSQEEMMILMNSVDIILMPYSPKKYATMPSAIFTEGLPMGKTFVLPNNTWAQQEAKAYDAGYMDFVDYDAQAILKALMRVIVSFEKLKNKSVVAGMRFYAENNMTNYIDVFLKLAREFKN